MKKLTTLFHALKDKLLKTGFVSVFMSNAACKVFAFLGGAIIVRVMTKNDYGQYSYIINCYGMLCLLNDLGCGDATLQFCNEHHDCPEKSNDFFVYGYRKALTFCTVTSLLILLSPLFYPFQDEISAKMTPWLCLMPFINTTNNFFLVNLRVRLKNNLYAVINVFTTVIHYVAILPLAYFFGIEGALISNYVIAISVTIFSAWISRKHFSFHWKGRSLTAPERKGFLKLAFATQLNNGISQLLVLVDIFMIGLFVADNIVISSYKIATTIPSAMAFIPASVMIYIIPYFARHYTDKAWVRRNSKKVILYSALGNGLLVAALIATSPWLIPFLFGQQYADAIPCYIILLIGYFFSATFRIPSSNIIYTQHKVRTNVIITTICGCLTCILDVILIMTHGSIGAAVANMTVQIVNAGLNFGYLLYILRKDNIKK